MFMPFIKFVLIQSTDDTVIESSIFSVLVAKCG